MASMLKNMARGSQGLSQLYFLNRHVRCRLGSFHEQPASSVFILQYHWWYRFGYRLYYACFHFGQMVSGKTRFCHRSCDYGFWFWCLVCQPIIQFLIEQVGLIYCFLTLGCLYLVIMLPSALYLEPPKETKGTEQVKARFLGKHISLQEAMHMRCFMSLLGFIFT